MMTTSKVVRLACLLTLGAFVACAGGPTVVEADEVIAKHRAGETEAAQLAWVQDQSRTFDLTEDDIARLAEAGLSERVIDAMLARSEEHHKEHGKSEEHDHEH